VRAGDTRTKSKRINITERFFLQLQLFHPRVCVDKEASRWHNWFLVAAFLERVEQEREIKRCYTVAGPHSVTTAFLEPRVKGIARFFQRNSFPIDFLLRHVREDLDVEWNLNFDQTLEHVPIGAHCADFENRVISWREACCLQVDRNDLFDNRVALPILRAQRP